MVTDRPLRDSAQVIAPPPLLLLGALAAAGALHLYVPVGLGLGALGRWAGLLFASIAAILGGWAILNVKRAGSTVRPHLPVHAIVCRGPYRLTRNPMYLGLLLLLLAAGLWTDSIWFFAAVLPLALALHFGVVLREERYLEQKFGSVYINYKESVRRWL
jgi:protein-S-isoprenylcysteine O-methyltransferase Ste14